MNLAAVTFSPAKAKSPRLRDEFARWMKMKGKSDKTIADYVNVVLAFVLFSGKRDPRTLGRLEVKLFLTHSRVETTMIYNHVINPVARRIKSPLD